MMKQIRYIFILLALLTMPSLRAQTEFSRKALKKDIHAKLKAEKYADADNQLRKAMDEHPELKIDTEINYIETGIQNKLVEAENRKIFLESKPDTAKYFSHIYEVYHYALATGYGDKKYRKQLSNYLVQYRSNLRNAGIFHFKKGQYQDAFKYLDMYLATTDYPLVVQHHDFVADPDTVTLARLASISAFGAKDYSSSLYYLKMVLNDTVNIMNMLEIGVKAGLAKKDTVTAYDYMKRGWDTDSTSQFFSFALLDYYQQKHDYDSVLFVISKSLVTLPPDSSVISRLYYIRGKSQEIIGNDDEALVSFDSTSVYAPSDVKAYYNKGLIFIRRAHRLVESNNASPGTMAYQSYKSNLRTLYSSAMESFEKVRALAPEDSSMWLTELRECYYQLNKGKELKKLEQYEKKS